MYLSTESLPPRSVPIFSRLIILSGGFFSLFGWIFFGFGMIFFWLFFMNSEAIHWFSFSDWEETTGTVIRVEETGASENEVSVMEYFYEYQLEGNTYTGRGYTTGSYFTEGNTIPVQYDLNDVKISRMKGERRELFGWPVIFVVIFPLLGLIFVGVSLNQNIKALDLLLNGKFARGKMINKEPTNTQINSQTVYKYTFEFQSDSGKTYEAIGKTHITSLLEDEETERLIYLPSNPAYATMYDTIANAPEIQSDGNLGPVSLTKAWTLIPPLVTILGHGAYAYFRYFI